LVRSGQVRKGLVIEDLTSDREEKRENIPAPINHEKGGKKEG
jgi:hypothetical protein